MTTQVTLAELSRMRQEQALVAGLEFYHGILLQRSTAFLMQAAAQDDAHTYLQTGYERLRALLIAMPKEFQPAVTTFTQKVDEIRSRLDVGSKGERAANLGQPLTLEIALNQYRGSTQMFAPVKFAGHDKGLAAALYEHCRQSFAHHHPTLHVDESDFHSYLSLSAAKALNGDLIRDRVENYLPAELKRANLHLKLTDCFCFPYLPNGAQRAAPKDAETPKPHARGPAEQKPAAQSGKYADEILQDVYRLRDSGMKAPDVAKSVNEKHGTSLKPGNVAAIMACRRRKK